MTATKGVPLSAVIRKINPAESVDAGVSYLNAGVLNRGRGLFAKAHLAGSSTAATKLYRLSSGNVVYSKLFAWEGSVALVTPEFHGYYVSSEFPIFEVDVERVDLGYLKHVLAWGGTLDQVAAMGSGLGQRRQRVNPDRFVTTHIPLTSLPDQRRIAAHLDSVAIASSQIAEPLQGRRLDQLASLPWKGDQVQLSDLVVEISRTRQVDPGATYRMAGVRWYGEGLFVRESVQGSALSARSVYGVEVGDLVYNRLFAWKQSFAIATEPGLTVSSEFPTFRVNSERVRPEILARLLLSADFTAQVNAASTGSTPTSRNRLKVRDFLTLTVEVPPLAAQAHIARILELATSARDTHRRRQTVAAALLPAARNEVFSSLR